ncbi:ATP-binding protein [Microvirga sp. VF16]|uniref:AAA family ATPase n=1 Tax=Microvirga sp. VF16 TaxID=2807101 RepID=UPI00193DE849|nr:ATP-binding protein [Microvirga sp. VF16]QRM36031.1 ATP-binding protein [Microvirga sp. VF16]
MDWCQNLLRDLAAWRAGALPFQALDRRCVWASEPGCGKTTLARSLAKEAGLGFVATSIGSWFSDSAGFLDSVIKEWRNVVGRAAAHGNSILFIDELDALPDRRTVGDRNRDFWNALSSQILLDTDESSNLTAGLIIIGATNFAERIDPALVRPGRLNRIIRIEKPDLASLAGIMRLHLAGDLADSDLAPLAQLAAGATGADVALWVKRARSRARRAGRAMLPEDVTAEIRPADTRSPRRCGVSPSMSRRMPAFRSGSAPAPCMASQSSTARAGPIR